MSQSGPLAGISAVRRRIGARAWWIRPYGVWSLTTGTDEIRPGQPSKPLNRPHQTEKGTTNAHP